MTTARDALPVPLPPSFSLDHQAIVVSPAKPGETAAYASAAFPHTAPSNGDMLASNKFFPKTAYDCFERGLALSRDKPCLGRRPWDAHKRDWATKLEFETYAQVAGRRDRIASALRELAKRGVLGHDHVQSDPGAPFMVGIQTVNRPEWQVVAQACHAQSLAIVSLYDTLGKDTVEYCIQHSECRVVFATQPHIPDLIRLAAKCSSMKAIVAIDPFDDAGAGNGNPNLVKGGSVLKQWANAAGLELYDWTEFEALGAQHVHPHHPPSRKTIGSICYTSGTTGNPKGAILTQELLAAAAVSNLHSTMHGLADASEHVYLSYLPLSHILARFCEDMVVTVGASIVYSCGDNLRLLEDVQLARPTIFVSVPRVLNRVYQALTAATIHATGVKGMLARQAVATKLTNLREHGRFTHAVWDKVLFRKVRAALGGRVQLIGTGSAPISPDVLEFLKIAFSCEVCEGLGSTENAGTATRCVVGDHKPNGTVGMPAAGVEIKLVDVPDMGYLASDKPHPRGEICTRGLVNSPGYYKDEEKTREAFDADGWYHSGDVGLIDDKGRLKIIDRIKNLVKLSQGEYVALERIENVYLLCPLLQQIYVHGDSLRDHVVALAIPNPDTFAPFASEITKKHIAPTDTAALMEASRNPRVIRALEQELAPFAKRAGLNGFEQIKAVHIHLEPFTPENDLLTPTFKTKRNVASKRFRPEIDGLYARTTAATKSRIAKL